MGVDAVTPGRVEVIAGPMFAGKTEELMRRVRRAAIARRPVQVFTHAVDRRSRAGTVSSHAGLEFPSTPVADAVELERSVAPDVALVAIDEAQFFGPALIPVVDRLARRGIDAIVAGLDVTFEGQPFEPLPSLMALAERADKLTAVCAVCGADAIFHQRMAPSTTSPRDVASEHIGGLEKYEARCRLHFQPA
jgi:thymidine kinase